VDLLSEEEQWEALKRWLRTNGPFIAVMVVVLLAGWFGWRWWQARGDEQAAVASVTYDKILKTFDENKVDDALAQIEALRTAHAKSAYVAAADLAAAKVFVTRNELDKAVLRLERVANQSVDEKLRPIARLRLARVLSAQAQYDKALTTLGTADMGEHQLAFLEARGDVHFAKGDRAAALREYEAARKLVPTGEQANADAGELLDLKINDLRGVPLVVPPTVEVPAALAAPTAAPAAAAGKP
jgi:predicted negative regulator of RcsB-dependent stress response